jgi:hypothetical protein
MHLTRPGSALVAAAAIALLLAACTSGAGGPSNGKTGPTATSGHAPARPDGLSTSSAVSAVESVLDCATFIGNSAPAAPLRVVLGVVALSASPGYPALQTSLSGDGGGPLRLFAKTGLVIRAGTTFELIVPSRFSIAWGAPGTPSHRVLVRKCGRASDGWLHYAGGYWIDHPACVPVIVRAGGKQQLVRIGVGTSCPGQRPPQGPSQG